MNKQSDTQHNLQDNDIAALFDTQDISVPESLDNIILTASRQVQADSPSSTRLNKYSPLFAIAAVLVLAVTLAPLLLQEPESIMQEVPPITSKDVTRASATPAADVTRNKRTNDTAAPEESMGTFDAQKSSLGEALILSPEHKAYTESLPNAQAPMAATSGVSTLSSTGNVAQRKFAANWITKIQALLAAKKYAEARVEYDLFRKKFPSYRLDIEIPSQ